MVIGKGRVMRVSIDDSDIAFKINHSFKVRKAFSDHRVNKQNMYLCLNLRRHLTSAAEIPRKSDYRKKYKHY